MKKSITIIKSMKGTIASKIDLKVKNNLFINGSIIYICTLDLKTSSIQKTLHIPIL
jgi:hypothetical protein